MRAMLSPRAQRGAFRATVKVPRYARDDTGCVLTSNAMTAYPISVKGVLVHQDHVLLLLNERGEWDLPGGRPEPGEDHRSALQREVQEETGLAVEVGAALDEHLFEVLPGRFVRIVPFACRLVGGGN